MMDVLAPLDAIYRDHPDFNEADGRAEIQALFERQKLIEDLLAGKIPYDVLLDCLNDQGVDPMAYVDMAISNIDYVLESQQQFDPNEVSLYLPYHLCPGS